MCLEDIRLQRQSRSTQNVVTVGIASTDLVPANDKRTTLVISRPITNRITLSFKGSAVDQNGIVLDPGGLPFVMTLECHGDMVTRRISAIANAAPETIGIWESELLVE